MSRELTVRATVVSRPAPDRAILDAGSKSLSSTALRPKFGTVATVGAAEVECRCRTALAAAA